MQYTKGFTQFSNLLVGTAPASNNALHLIIYKGDLKAYYHWKNPLTLVDFLTKANGTDWKPGRQYQANFIRKYGTEAQKAALASPTRYTKPSRRPRNVAPAPKPLTMHQKAAAFDAAQKAGMMTVAKKEDKIEVFVNLSPLPTEQLF